MLTIFEKLKRYVNKNYYSTHMPGHKSGELLPPDLAEAFGKEIFRYDITEVEGLDNLQDPQGSILETEKRIAEIAGAEKAYILVNGSTCGILTALFSLARETEVFVDSNCHQAVHNGMILSGSSPIYLENEYDSESGIPLGISPSTLLEAIDKYPECKALVVTYPNYFGIRNKAEEIFRIARENNIAIIVDEAHGAHFNFMQKEILNAILLGADLVVQSWHKTLPVLNQGSILLVGKRYKGFDFRERINIFQTSSPSYLIMASIDSAAKFLEDKEDCLIESARIIRKVFSEARFMNIRVQKEDSYEQDPFKLLVTSKKNLKKITKEILLEKYGIQPEILESHQILFMFPLLPERSILLKVLEALREIDVFLEGTEDTALFTDKKARPMVRKFQIDPREIYFGKKKLVSLEQSVEKICAQRVVKYPPGIPFVFPGELMTKEMICYLDTHKINYNLQDGIKILKD